MAAPPQKSRKEQQQDSLPWVEKYRPKKITDVAHQSEVVRVLIRAVETANLPHLLFYGPPGTGKTSTILAVARQLYAPEIYRQRVLELNASDERGIKVVRTKIKDFASTAVSSKPIGDFPCPPYKIIVLDEADAMTRDAQTALRRTMETFSKVTRFCIICNYVSRIIQPLSSRCAKFRFQPLESEAMIDRLRHIAGEEGVEAGDEVMASVVRCSGGDMRKAITLLQSAHQYGPNGADADLIVELAAMVPDEAITNLVNACLSNHYQKLQLELQDMVCMGYPASQILSQLHDAIIRDPKLRNSLKGTVCEAIAQADDCLCDGANDFLQLSNVCTTLMKAKSL